MIGEALYIRTIVAAKSVPGNVPVDFQTRLASLVYTAAPILANDLEFHRVQEAVFG
jgi:hypothetical protein